MEKNKIVQIITENILIKRLKYNAEELSGITNDESLADRLSLSSIDEFEMILGVEDEFEIDLSAIDQDELHEHFRTIETMAGFIQGELALQLNREAN
ncbi:acyl carrier protein [Paenibacillus pinihumi]|uniref:acyl carrier protein n=1 Tax=Paenibacillus pinihumi TaxID=669462 RepID=UPI00048D9E8A|nr:hypothetical protein [Paenibacillus pinihumi]